MDSFTHKIPSMQRWACRSMFSVGRGTSRKKNAAQFPASRPPPPPPPRPKHAFKILLLIRRTAWNIPLSEWAPVSVEFHLWCFLVFFFKSRLFMIFAKSSAEQPGRTFPTLEYCRVPFEPIGSSPVGGRRNLWYLSMV